MNRLKRYITLLSILCVPGGDKRARFLKKMGYFKNQGVHCSFTPFNFGTEPHLISFGNNVQVATGVTFVNHDTTCMVFKYLDKQHMYKIRQGEINIGNNVFIGANSTILYDVKIGNNVIVGAGSLVNKDIPDGVIVAGVPCKIIGSFDEYMKRLRD